MTILLSSFFLYSDTLTYFIGIGVLGFIIYILVETNKKQGQIDSLEKDYKENLKEGGSRDLVFERAFETNKEKDERMDKLMKQWDTQKELEIEMNKIFISNQKFVKNLKFEYEEKLSYSEEPKVIEEFYSNGNLALQLESTGAHVNVIKQYYESGKLMALSSFFHEYKDGAFEFNFENGSFLKYHFMLNILDKYFEYYYDNGNLKEKIIFDISENHDGIGESYDENGNLKSKAIYKGGETHGTSYGREYFTGHNIINVLGVFKEGKKDGEYEQYHEDGYVWKTTIFKNGIKQLL